MSTPTNDGVPIYRPKPRRPFELTPLTSTASECMATEPKLDLPGWISDDILSPSSTSTSSTNGSTTPSDYTKRTKSILNLTTSTLFGIYSPTYNDVIQPPTPSFLSRANSVVDFPDTPSINGSSMVPNNESPSSKTTPESPRRRRRRGKRTSISRLTMRLTALFVFGIGYGFTVMHLRNIKTFTPAWWEEIEEYSAGYLVLWGVVGVTLGSLLPWIDYFLDEPGREAVDGEAYEGTVDWIRVVRSIGAFVGIAYGVVSFFIFSIFPFFLFPLSLFFRVHWCRKLIQFLTNNRSASFPGNQHSKYHLHSP